MVCVCVCTYLSSVCLSVCLSFVLLYVYLYIYLWHCYKWLILVSQKFKKPPPLAPPPPPWVCECVCVCNNNTHKHTQLIYDKIINLVWTWMLLFIIKITQTHSHTFPTSLPGCVVSILPGSFSHLSIWLCCKHTFRIFLPPLYLTLL